jgi:hypothetical protein
LIRETGKDHVSTALRTKNVHSLVGILTCLSLAILAARAREVLELEVVDLVNDDAEDSETVAWVRRSTVDVQLLGSVDRSTSLDLRTKSETEVATEQRNRETHLELREFLQLSRESMVDSGGLLERGVELGLVVVRDGPREGSGETVGVLEAHQRVLPLDRLTRLEHELFEGDGDASNEVVGGEAVGIPELDGEVLVRPYVVVRDHEIGRLLPYCEVSLVSPISRSQEGGETDLG